MSEKIIGKVEKFFQKPSVAAIRAENEGIKVGDRVRIQGATTDFTMEIESMEIEHQKVNEAKAGDLVGIKTAERVRPGDTVALAEEE